MAYCSPPPQREKNSPILYYHTEYFLLPNNLYPAKHKSGERGGGGRTTTFPPREKRILSYSTFVKNNLLPPRPPSPHNLVPRYIQARGGRTKVRHPQREKEFPHPPIPERRPLSWGGASLFSPPRGKRIPPSSTTIQYTTPTHTAPPPYNLVPCYI